MTKNHQQVLFYPNPTTLKNAKGDRLNAIIDYAGFDISERCK